MLTKARASRDEDEGSDDRPSFARVETFLSSIDRRQKSARRTRLFAVAVGATIAGVAFLTAIGVVPVEAENVVISASAVVARLAFTSGSGGQAP